MKESLKILYIKPYQTPVEMTINNTLKDMQKLVKGNIKYMFLPNDDEVSIVCNADGETQQLNINRYIDNDIIYGNFFVVGNNKDLSDHCSLTQKQIDKYIEYFGENSIQKTRDKIAEYFDNYIKNI